MTPPSPLVKAQLQQKKTPTPTRPHPHGHPHTNSHHEWMDWKPPADHTHPKPRGWGGWNGIHQVFDGHCITLCDIFSDLKHKFQPYFFCPIFNISALQCTDRNRINLDLRLNCKPFWLFFCSILDISALIKGKGFALANPFVFVWTLSACGARSWPKWETSEFDLATPLSPHYN